MCGPKPPPPTPIRQAPRAPDLGMVGDRSQERLLKRQTMSGMIMTGGQMGAAPKAGKPVLGA